ncbi:hypothetical protein MSIMFI_01587 [Mycobacterium simulans]|nr:hypothetical protein MSIMFI_01587 [Mycobacterium simulans]
MPICIELLGNTSLMRRKSWPRVGRFRYIARENRWDWSDEITRMHGYEPGRVTPTTDLLLTHKHPDDKPTVLELIERTCRYGVPFSNRHRIIDTGGDVHVVVVVANPIYDGRGVVTGAAGFFVDITHQFQADVQEQLTGAVLAVNARRAVINQALGVLMLQHGLDADAAFELLTRLSQRSNTKVRVLAERIVADAAGREAPLSDVASAVDGLLRVPQGASN